jgi:hypothetical protein
VNDADQNFATILEKHRVIWPIIAKTRKPNCKSGG